MAIPWAEAVDRINTQPVEEPEAVTTLLRGILGTNLPYWDDFSRWMAVQGLDAEASAGKLKQRRMELTAFVSDHHPETLQAPAMVRRVVARIARECVVHARGGFPVTRAFLEGIVTDEIREFVIAARGPLVHHTGITDDCTLTDVMQPQQISEALCTVTTELAARRGVPGICWCGRHATAEDGFQPLPVVSRCLDSGVVRDAVAAIRTIPIGGNDGGV